MTSPVFADSSALVKLYADESDADLVRSVSLFVVSQLARVEVPAALWKKNRIGDLAPASTSALIADFEADYFGTVDEPQRFVIIDTADAVLDDAVRLISAHGLRAYDAVQLASAVACRSTSADELTFLAFDKGLYAAAGAEGFELWGGS